MKGVTSGPMFKEIDIVVNMFNCRIGIIAKPNISNIPYLNIGEYIGDKDNITLLYQLHTDLSYLYPFWGISIPENGRTEIVPTNIKDFIYLQNKYNLTKEIFISKEVEDKLIQFNAPQLYDISCGVKLFDHSVNKRVIRDKIRYKPSNKNIIFVIPDYQNPMNRGKSIETSLNKYFSSFYDREPFFIVLGDTINPNKIETWKLSKRYLIKRGVSSDCICTTECSENIIKSICEIIPFITSNEDIIIYLSVRSLDMSKYLIQSRNINKKLNVYFINF